MSCEPCFGTEHNQCQFKYSMTRDSPTAHGDLPSHAIKCQRKLLRHLRLTCDVKRLPNVRETNLFCYQIVKSTFRVKKYNLLLKNECQFDL